MSEEQTKYSTNTGDQELYRRLSVPFATKAEKAARVEDFYGIVKAAREQLGIPDVHLIIRTNYIDGEGVERHSLAEAHLGSSEAALGMLGYGYMGAIEKHLEFLEYVQAVGEKTAVADAAQATDGASKAMSNCNDAMAGSDLASACLSYRHDYGLMDAKDKEGLHRQAREWARAFGLEEETAVSGKGEFCRWDTDGSGEISKMFRTSCGANVEVKIDGTMVVSPKTCPFCKKTVRAGLETAVYV